MPNKLNLTIPTGKIKRRSSSKSEKDHLAPKSPHFFDFPGKSQEKPKMTIGICAMEHKARSRPMQSILEKLGALNEYSIIIFGDKTLQNEEPQNWPRCQLLIAFYSTGFPIEKAYTYIKLYKPFTLNSILHQFLLFDRRVVLSLLDKIGVETPERLVAQRDNGPDVFKAAKDFIQKKFKFKICAEFQGHTSVVEMVDHDTICIDGVEMTKPFIEKPVYAEDHNIYIYYHSSMGGGVRKLFRKIGNRSSQFYPDLFEIRTDGSFVYEKFYDTNGSVDVKVYTLGATYLHAETRKSPCIDGIVRRDAKGKEVRFVTQLSKIEQKYASLITSAFSQRICGFDLLRVGDKSMVMDINGWSFVKGDQDYHRKAAMYLDQCFYKYYHSKWVSRFVNANDNEKHDLESDYQNRWVLKGYFSVCRHADRTPKQKAKWTLFSPEIAKFFSDSKSEVILRNGSDLESFLAAINSSIANLDKKVFLADLESIRDTLERKMHLLGTKIQLKPKLDSSKTNIVEIQVVIKWGGEITHAGLLQTLDLAENVKKDLNLLNPELLKDVKMYRSDERRVEATAGTFYNVVCSGANNPFFKDDISALSNASVNLEECFNTKILPLSRGHIIVDSELLDDASATKDETEKAKIHLRNFFNFRGNILENIYNAEGMALPAEMEGNPREFIKSIGFLLAKLVSNMHKNFKHLNSEKLKILQPDWCCHETPKLFKERWEKMLKDFRLEVFDEVILEPSKIGELYDSLKYDALHSRGFLETVLSDDLLEFELVNNEHLRAGTNTEQAFEKLHLKDKKYVNYETHPSQQKHESESASASTGVFESYTRSEPLREHQGVHLHSEENLLEFEFEHPPVVKGSNFELNSQPNLGDTKCLAPAVAGSKHSPSIISSKTQSQIDQNAKTWLFGNQRQRHKDLVELYHKSKVLFDFVTPREYGISNEQKLHIGLLGSKDLFSLLIKEFKQVISGSSSRSRFYFTKESHLHTLLNLVYNTKFPTLIPFEDIGELDYLTHVTFEIYEREQNKHLNPNNEFSLRLGFSSGSSCKNLMDIEVGENHVLSVANRINFTDHIPLEEAISLMENLVSHGKY